MFFFFEAEGRIRDSSVTGVKTCALPISRRQRRLAFDRVAVGIPDSYERRVGAKSRSLDSRQRADIFHQGLKKSAYLFIGVVLLLRQRHSHRQEMIGLKSELLFPQIPDGLDHQPSAHHQSESQRKLPDHERIPQPQSPARFSASASFLERLLQRHAAASQRRRQAKQYSRRNRYSGGE